MFATYDNRLNIDRHMYTCMSERLEVQHYDAFSVEHKIMQSFRIALFIPSVLVQLDSINGWPYLSVVIDSPA